MAVTLVAGQIASATSAAAVGSLGVSLPNPTGSGNVVLAKASCDTSGGVTISNVKTDKGDTVTQQWLQNVASHGGNVGGYAAKVTSGSQVITATFSASVAFTAIAAYEVTGNDQTTPVDAAATTSSQDGGSAPSSFTSPSVTPARSGGFIWGACFIGSTVGYTAMGANSPFTIGETEVTNTGTASEYDQQSVAAAIQASFNVTGGTEDHWAVGVITIQPPSSAAPDHPTLSQRSMRGPAIRWPFPKATPVPDLGPLPGTGPTLPPPLQTKLEFRGPFQRLPSVTRGTIVPVGGATAWVQGSGSAVASGNAQLVDVPASSIPIAQPLAFRGPFDHIGRELTQPGTAQAASAGASQYGMGTATAVASSSGAIAVLRALAGTGNAVASSSGAFTTVPGVVQAPLMPPVILGGQSQLWIRSIRPKLAAALPPPSTLDALTGSGSAVATSSGTVVVLRATSGSTTAVATSSEQLQVLRAIAGTSPAVASSDGQLQALRAFAGTSAAVATANGSMSTGGGQVQALLGTGSGIGNGSVLCSIVPAQTLGGGGYPKKRRRRKGEIQAAVQQPVERGPEFSETPFIFAPLRAPARPAVAPEQAPAVLPRLTAPVVPLIERIAPVEHPSAPLPAVPEMPPLQPSQFTVRLEDSEDLSDDDLASIIAALIAHDLL